MADFWTIKCKGGPKHGTRCVPIGFGGLQWPLPDTLDADGGVYRKVSESQFPDDSATHVSRGAEYRWEQNQSIGEMVRDHAADDECPDCAELEDACPACARKIHESWHAIGMWWIRQEECHPGCPGRKSAEQRASTVEPKTE